MVSVVSLGYVRFPFELNGIQQPALTCNVDNGQCCVCVNADQFGFHVLILYLLKSCIKSLFAELAIFDTLLISGRPIYYSQVRDR